MGITKAQALVWVIALTITARLVYAAAQHGMAVLDVAATALLAAYGFKAAVENVAASVRRARTGGQR